MNGKRVKPPIIGRVKMREALRLESNVKSAVVWRAVEPCTALVSYGSLVPVEQDLLSSRPCPRRLEAPRAGVVVRGVRRHPRSGPQRGNQPEEFRRWSVRRHRRVLGGDSLRRESADVGPVARVKPASVKQEPEPEALA